MSTTTQSTSGTSPQQEAVSKQELTEILSGMSLGGSDADYLGQVIKHDIALKYLRKMKPEFERAHILANRDEARLWEAEHLVRYRTNLFLAEHPPEGSKMQGSFRELVYGDTHEPLSPNQVRDVLAIEGVLLARLTQSESMEQQSVIKEMRQDKRIESTANDATSGGMLSKIFR